MVSMHVICNTLKASPPPHVPWKWTGTGHALSSVIIRTISILEIGKYCTNVHISYFKQKWLRINETIKDRNIILLLNVYFHSKGRVPVRGILTPLNLSTAGRNLSTGKAVTSYSVIELCKKKLPSHYLNLWWPSPMGSWNIHPRVLLY